MGQWLGSGGLRRVGRWLARRRPFLLPSGRRDLPRVPAAVPLVRQPALKRGMDLFLSGLGLLLSAPLWPLIVGAIRREDGGPIFDPEMRWGRGGVGFRILKFRTVARSPDQPGALPSPTGEKHFTRVGRFLRARGLDEIPQLINIWRGEMSFVGPRPLAVAEIPVHLEPELLAQRRFEGFVARLAVRPGPDGDRAGVWLQVPSASRQVSLRSPLHRTTERAAGSAVDPAFRLAQHPRALGDAREEAMRDAEGDLGIRTR